MDRSKKGGDIDLYVETHVRYPADILHTKIKFLTKLVDKIGDQKIDILIKYDNYELPIFVEAKYSGVRLK